MMEGDCSFTCTRSAKLQHVVLHGCQLGRGLPQPLWHLHRAAGKPDSASGGPRSLWQGPRCIISPRLCHLWASAEGARGSTSKLPTSDSIGQGKGTASGNLSPTLSWAQGRGIHTRENESHRSITSTDTLGPRPIALRDKPRSRLLMPRMGTCAALCKQHRGPLLCQHPRATGKRLGCCCHQGKPGPDVSLARCLEASR